MLVPLSPLLPFFALLSVHVVRARGGNLKLRAMRLDTGNFAWGSETCTRKTRILDVVYNSSNNELVRTKTLVKGAIVQIDATPYRQFYEQKYATTLGKKKKGDEVRRQSNAGMLCMVLDAHVYLNSFLLSRLWVLRLPPR